MEGTFHHHEGSRERQLHNEGRQEGASLAAVYTVIPEDSGGTRGRLLLSLVVPDKSVKTREIRLNATN